MEETLKTIAAVDLGSNSFHMIVAQVTETDALQKVDKLKEMVRLRGGLDDENNLSKEKEAEAIACLQQFGERIRHLPSDCVRIAGTNTLRTMQDASQFLYKAKEALGHSVNIIAGREEARLVYLGVSHTLSDDHGLRFVMDIGGGSTEFIIGKEFKPLQLESLNVGSVSMTQQFFPDGKLSKKNWKKANKFLCLEMTPLKTAYRKSKWDVATGSSGSIKATRSIIQALGLEKFGITLQALHNIRDRMIKAGHIDNLDLPGLKAERFPVYAGGLAVLIAAFETLKIDEMTVSDGALREGLLYDLIGRIHHEDIRESTVIDLINRFSIDPIQSDQVEETAIFLFQQVREKLNLEDKHFQLLSWAAKLHELGLSITHSAYHKHGAYILEHADLPGFSRKEQQWLAIMVETHRRKVREDVFDVLPSAQQKVVKYLSVLLRLSVLLHRSRMAESILPEINIDNKTICFTCKQLATRPMLAADFEREKDRIDILDFKLDYHQEASSA